MTTFEDGPAKGQALELRRAPRFLRVVRYSLRPESIGWDALDLLDDEPSATEELFAYEIVGEAVRGFIRRTGGGGLFTMATYRFVAVQPTDAEMRNAETWSKWCHAQAAKI